jgi:hypothetical protein
MASIRMEIVILRIRIPICVMSPGTYTLVSYHDDNFLGTTNASSLQLIHASKTKYDSPAKADVLDTIKNFGSYATRPDNFTCSVNPDTIDGVFCGRRNTYHVFYLDRVATSESYLSAAINTTMQENASVCLLVTYDRERIPSKLIGLVLAPILQQPIHVPPCNRVGTPSWFLQILLVFQPTTALHWLLKTGMNTCCIPPIR